MLQDMLTLIIEKKGFFLNLLLEHVEISLISIVIASVLGLLSGILISEYQKSSRTVLSIINFVYTIPSIALLGFLIPFSGIGNPTAILALTIYGLLPMVRNTHTGIMNIDKSILEAAKGMGSTRVQILLKIKLPLALPIIMSGLRNMTTMTIALAGIASFIGAGGLGVAIYRGITTNNSAMAMVGSLLIAILALVTDGFLGLIEKMTLQRREKIRIKNKVMAGIALVLCVVVVGSAIVGGILKKDTLNIATKPMTEQYIVGAMLKEVIEQDTNLEVNITQGVGGGTSNIMPGMKNGKFDMYPEYTSTAWNMVLKHEGFYDESMYEQLQEEYAEQYGFTWTGKLGFNDSYGLAVRKELAEKHQLKTYSDLEKISEQLVFGAEYDFYERPDGYDALCDTYDFRFQKTVDLDIGLKYQAMSEERVDVMDIFTTDGQLAAAEVVVLEDDRNFFSSAMGVMVVRTKILEKYPELHDVFAKLEGILDEQKMAEMNYAVETKGKDAEDVAKAFLRNAGLVK